MNLNTPSAASPTRELARWISNLRYDDLPQPTRDVVHIHILDTLGAGLYGHTTLGAKMLVAWAHSGSTGKGQAHVWGELRPSLRPADAAMVNATAAHSFELDDYHNAKVHPGSAVIPAAMAVAERLGSSGSDLVTAIAAGFEVIIRTSLALSPSAATIRGWHLQGVCGPFGAAAACASLMKLDPKQTAWAIGLAGNQSAGLFAFNAEGDMSKQLHAGKAAHSGVLAAEFAQQGITGPTRVFELAHGGALSTFSDHSDPTPLTQGLGTIYHLDQTSIKTYSCCGSNHSYVDAALALRRKFGAPWDTRRPVRVGTCKAVALQCGFDYVPSSALNAQMSMRYDIAVALLDGQVLPPQFSDARLADPEIMALAGMLQLVPDPALDLLYPKNFAAWVAAKADGRWERVDMLNPSGSWQDPLDAKGVTRKFFAINPDLPTDRIVNAVFNIERHSVRELMALLVPFPSAGSSQSSGT